MSNESRKKKIKFLSKKISRLKKAIKRLKDKGIRRPWIDSENLLERELACLIDDIMHCYAFMEEVREAK